MGKYRGSIKQIIPMLWKMSATLMCKILTRNEVFHRISSLMWDYWFGHIYGRNPKCKTSFFCVVESVQIIYRSSCADVFN